MAGASALIEMVYHIQLNAGTGSQFRFVGVALDTESRRAGSVSAAVLAVGLVGARVRPARASSASGAGPRKRSRPRSSSGSRRDAHPTYALELQEAHKRFGKTEIIRGAELAVAPGERVAIIGPNGAGKSTLFNLISGRFGPSSGEILLNGERIDGLTPFEINRLGLARSFQITNIFGRLSVFENLRCGVLWSLGYKYAFWKFLADLKDANERAEAAAAA